MTRVFIHLPKKLLLQTPPGGDGFYKRLHDALDGAGHAVKFVQRYSLSAGPDYPSGHFHFVHQGLVQQPNVLNTGVAYVYPFWYADPRGVFGESSIADLPFEPGDPTAARQFHTRLQNRLIGKRISKYAQPEHTQPLPKGAISVFLQGPSLPVKRAQYMSEVQMLDTILAGADGRPVLVKPHPRTADPVVMRHIDALKSEWPNLHVVDANIHDMLEACDVTCSVSSSVSIEGFVHEKPGLLFGKTDFHHIAQTVEQADQFAPALQKALGARPPYAAFLHWFFQINCINMGSDDWFDRIQAKMT